nr:MAG TPA: hypothetical protein [Crassvirales sp.]
MEVQISIYKSRYSPGKMQTKFNLKSVSTILWIVNGGTNKHI